MGVKVHSFNEREKRQYPGQEKEKKENIEWLLGQLVFDVNKLVILHIAKYAKCQNILINIILNASALTQRPTETFTLPTNEQTKDLPLVS